MNAALDRLDRKFQAEQAPAVNRVQRHTFEEFLREDAMVPIGKGQYGKYSFEGREVLLAIVRRTDEMLGSETGQPLQDSLLALAGGAQWGKTIYELNLAAYSTSQQFFNFGLYLPDNDLANAVIDTKFRPDVLDQIDWLARMTQVGKIVNKSGKQVNTKRGVSMTDGDRRANFLISGLQKPATTVSLDITARDEEDDIPPKNAKFVKGRMGASQLRIQFIIGTQRVYGRGQQKAWEDGSQGVTFFGPISDAWQYEPSEEVDAVPEGYINAEESFPEIIRHAVTGIPRPDDPKLTWAADFRHDPNGEIISTHKPTNTYYLAHPVTGEPLDRRIPLWHHRNPGQIEMRRFSYRVSQLAVGAIGLNQIVNQFTLAVEDPDEMVVFRCDVLALPKSTAQAITPEIIQRAQGVAPYELRIIREPQRAAFAGLDMGDKCWLWVREIESPARKRLIYAASIPAADVVRRIIALNAQNLWDCLFLDQRPSVAESRSIAMALNGLDAVTDWPKVPKITDQDATISFPSGLRWNGRRGRWENLRCAVVRFDKKRPGMGITQEFDEFLADGQTQFVPLINCNRDETIDRPVRELLTPDEGVVDYITSGDTKTMRVEPLMLLPSGELPIIGMVSAHLIAGSERERADDGSLGDYKDKIQNHLMLADGYSALAEIIGEVTRPAVFAHESVIKRTASRERSGLRGRRRVA